MATSTTKKTEDKDHESAEEKRYYIVNPAGAVHEVTRDHAVVRLKQPGYRMATPDEVAAYQAARLQRYDRPIATPWDPETQVE